MSHKGNAVVDDGVEGRVDREDDDDDPVVDLIRHIDFEECQEPCNSKLKSCIKPIS